jgi:hypothetical protein
MRRHACAELHGEHLGTEANSEKRPLIPEWHGDPVDLAPDKIVRIIRAHRAAEDNCAGMIIQRFRKGIAKTRTPDIQWMSERPQDISDTAWSRAFLVQDDQHGQQSSVG